MIFLFRWLLFRLRFMSGISKLVMNDPSCLNMAVLLYYFETQPIPHFGAWYFHNPPDPVLIIATVAVDSFLTALLENSPTVTGLLKTNPFADKAPEMLRVRVWH
jgi:hypothetical protein